MSTNKYVALRSVKAGVSPIIGGTATTATTTTTTGSRVALSRWARPSQAARRTVRAMASRVKPILSWDSSSKPKPSIEGVVDATTPNSPPIDAEPDHLAHAKPIDFDMASKIDGQESQMVSFELEPGQVIRVRRRRTALLLPDHFVAVINNRSYVSLEVWCGCLLYCCAVLLSLVLRAAASTLLLILQFTCS